MVSIYEYLDYRKYLADYYRARKIRNRHFSYRKLADKGGFSSTGYLSELVAGIRNLTPASIPKLGKALDLSPPELAYLERLVEFNHARTAESKQTAYKDLLAALPPRIQRLKHSQLEYFSKWYYVAIREALAVHETRGTHEDYEALARFLRPAIPTAQAKAAIRLLADLGLIHREADGRWLANHAAVLSQQEEDAALTVRSFQGEMLGLARQALEAIPRDERDITTATLSISSRGLDQVKSILAECRRRILDVVQSDTAEDRVVQLNLQLFPLTQSRSLAHAT